MTKDNPLVNDVYVGGIGETSMGKHPQRTFHDLVREAANAALDDAGVTIDSVEKLFFSNFNGQQLAHQGHMGPLVAEALGRPELPTLRVEGACVSGGLALMLGIEAIRTGQVHTVLVGGAEKMTHQSTGTVTGALAAAMDYEFEAKTGLTFPGSFAMIANRYFYEYRDVSREMAQVAVQSHDNALLNPHAQLRKAIDVDKVLDAPRIADPLGLFDCSLVTDGAAFIVLTADVGSLNTRHRRVKVTGTGHGGDALTLAGKKSMTTLGATVRAAAQAYKQAGRSPQDIDFAEVHDCFTITQIINTEDLGFFEKGSGANAVAEGRTRREGDKPINVSGGLKAKGHPIGATGISQAFEVVTQLRGDAEQRQLGTADIGLTHNLGGTAGTCVVNIWEGE